MGKAHTRFRGVDLAARGKVYGEIYVWLYRRHDRLLRDLTARTPGLWTSAAAEMVIAGVRSLNGRDPTGNSVGKAWLVVSRHYPEDAQRHAAERQTNTGHVSRRHKGWVPTSTLPPQPPAVQVATQQYRAPAPPPLPPVPAPSAPVPAIEPGQAPPLGHPDHPLGFLTALEIASLSDFINASVEIQRDVLITYREMRHMDRFSRPGWQ